MKERKNTHAADKIKKNVEAEQEGEENWATMIKHIIKVADSHLHSFIIIIISFTWIIIIITMMSDPTLWNEMEIAQSSSISW